MLSINANLERVQQWHMASELAGRRVDMVAGMKSTVGRRDCGSQGERGKGLERQWCWLDSRMLDLGLWGRCYQW